MKTITALLPSLILLLTLSSCGSVSSDITENTHTDAAVTEKADMNDIQNRPDIDELKEKYPEYFEMSDFKGIEVYVWQMSETSYRCGMMSGTNRNKTPEEILSLQSRSLSLDEAKAILEETGVKKEDIIIIPISQPYSSYACETDDEYIDQVEKMFE